MLSRNERSLSGFGPPSTTFRGSPNATITAISTAGGIAASRASGQLPCFVHVSASAITATGTSKPYEDLEYQWDFGDPNGSEIFTNPVTANSVNMNSGQYGPEGTYCYRTAGSKTVTLNIRGKNGGGFTTASVTATITVSAFSHSGGEFWFDQVNGNDGNNGTSSATPKQSMSALNALIASNTSFHLAKGSNWTGSTGIGLPGSNSGVRFDAYGSGANPIININGGLSVATSFYAFSCVNAGNSTQSDVVLSNLTLKNSTGTNTLAIVNVASTFTTAHITDIYFDHVDQTSTLNDAGLDDKITCSFAWGSNAGTMANNGIWGGSITSPQTTTAGGNAGGFFGGAQNWFFMIGVTMSGGSANSTFDHHIYPNCQGHVHFRYMNFGNGPGRNYCINSNWDGVGGATPEYSQFWLFSECYFSGTQLAHDLGNATNDPSLQRFKNIVTQLSAFTNLAVGAVYFISNAESLTVRDNNAWALSGAMFVPNAGANATILSPQIYRNKIYSVLSRGTATAGIVAGSASITTEWIVTDNIVMDTAADALLFDPVVATFQADAALIDRNQWWAPNDSDAKYLGATQITFAAWQAAGFDVNGSVANPSWPDPANGNFG